MAYIVPPRLVGWRIEREEVEGMAGVCVRAAKTWRGRPPATPPPTAPDGSGRGTRVEVPSTRDEFLQHPDPRTPSPATPPPPTALGDRVEPLYGPGARVYSSVVVALSGSVASWGLLWYRADSERVLRTGVRAVDRTWRRCAVGVAERLDIFVPRPPSGARKTWFWKEDLWQGHTRRPCTPPATTRRVVQRKEYPPASAGVMERQPMAMMDDHVQLGGCAMLMHGVELGDSLREQLLGIISKAREAAKVEEEPNVVSPLPSPSPSPASRSRADKAAEYSRRGQRPKNLHTEGGSTPSLLSPCSPRSYGGSARLSISIVSPRFTAEKLDLSETAWLVLSMKARKWCAQVRARVALRHKEAMLARCEGEWRLRELQETFRWWRMESLWRPWNRRRYLRAAWDNWQVYLTSVNDAKVVAITRLGEALTKITHWKTFIVWWRLTIVERHSAVPRLNFFPSPPHAVLPQWDSWFAEYQTERALTSRMKGFVTRHRLRGCLRTLYDYAALAKHHRKLDEMAEEFVLKKDRTVQRQCFAVMVRRMGRKTATVVYRRCLVTRAWGFWLGKFKKRLMLHATKLHVQCGRSLVLVGKAFGMWREKRLLVSRHKILLVMRAVVYRAKMLLPVLAVMSEEHFKLHRCFKKWSYFVRKHTEFMSFIVAEIASSTQRLLHAAFTAWRSGQSVTIPAFDWTRLDTIKAKIHNTQHLPSLGPIGSYLMVSRDGMILRDRGLLWEWLLEGRHTQAVLQGLAGRMVMYAAVRGALTKRTVMLRKYNLDKAQLEAPTDGGGDVGMGCDLRQFPITDREREMRRVLERRVMFYAQRPRGCSREQVLEEVRSSCGRHCEKGVGVGVGFLAWLQSNVIRNRAVVLRMTLRDRLLVVGKGAVAGLEVSQYEELSRKVKGVVTIHTCVATRLANTNRLVTKTDLTSLNSPTPPTPDNRRHDAHDLPSNILILLLQTLHHPPAPNPEMPLTSHFEPSVQQVISRPSLLDTIFEEKHTRAA